MKKPPVIHLIGLAGLAVLVAIACSEDPVQKPMVTKADPEPGVAMLGGAEASGGVAAAEDNSLAAALIGIVGPVESVAYGDLQCDDFITFGDVQSAPQPGVHYDAALTYGCVGIAERFVGQSHSTVMVGSYPHDSLTPSAGGPLALELGAPDENIGVASSTSCGTSEVLIGWGPLGYPEDWGGGEGSVAFLFDDDQSEFGLRVCGGNGGQVTLHFFGRDGSLIATAILSGVRDQEFGFRRTGGVQDIAGISIHNTDVGGVAFDDIVYDASLCSSCVEGAGVRVTPETFNVGRYGSWVTAHATLPEGYEAEDVTGATIVSIGSIETLIVGSKLGAGVFKFNSDDFAEIAGQLVGPEEPEMEDVPVCIVLTLSDGNMTCASCWLIDIINEGNPGGPDTEDRDPTSPSGGVDPRGR